jgi:hypothetical protein
MRERNYNWHDTPLECEPGVGRPSLTGVNSSDAAAILSRTDSGRASSKLTGKPRKSAIGFSRSGRRGRAKCRELVAPSPVSRESAGHSV